VAKGLVLGVSWLGLKVEVAIGVAIYLLDNRVDGAHETQAGAVCDPTITNQVLFYKDLLKIYIVSE